jgi:hypothetical protein
MGSYKGQPGNNKLGNPHWDKVRNRGSKKGVQRGPYKTKRSYERLMYEMQATKRPELKVVDGEVVYPGAKNFLRTVVQCESLAMRDRVQAAQGLLAFEEVKPQGQKLSVRWDRPAPTSLVDAFNQLAEIDEKVRKQEINDHDATMLRAGIEALYGPMDRIVLVNRIASLEGFVGTGEQYDNTGDVTVTGGLPALPGTSITMTAGERIDGVTEDVGKQSDQSREAGQNKQTEG